MSALLLTRILLWEEQLSGVATAEILLLNLSVKNPCFLLGLGPRGPRRALLPPDAFPSGYSAPQGLVLPEQTVRVRLSPANKGCLCFFQSLKHMTNRAVLAA